MLLLTHALAGGYGSAAAGVGRSSFLSSSVHRCKRGESGKRSASVHVHCSLSFDIDVPCKLSLVGVGERRPNTTVSSQRCIMFESVKLNDVFKPGGQPLHHICKS